MSVKLEILEDTCADDGGLLGSAQCRDASGQRWLLKATSLDQQAVIPSPLSQPWPLQQHSHYALALAEAGHLPAMWTIHRDDQPIAQALVMQRRLFALAHMRLLMRGPRWLSDIPSETEQVSVYQLLRWQTRLWRWRFTVVMPEHAPHKVLSAARLRQVMSGYATIWLDLSAEQAALRARLDGKWRHQLGQAERAGLGVAASGGAGASLRWLLEQEASQQSQRGYKALPPDFVARYRQIGGKTLTLLVSRGREKLAAGLFLLHGHSATYHMGVTTSAGRQVQAMNLLLWQAVLALKSSGIMWLDMGGLNTGPMASIARFKLGLRGLATTKSPALLPGAFV